MQLIDSISSFFISNAHADTAAAAPAQQGGFSFVVMMGILVFFMYFAIWRPQAKRSKEQKNLINSLVEGDEVVTAGGILGTIRKLTDNYVVLSFSNNAEITMQKSSIVSVLPKGTLKSI